MRGMVARFAAPGKPRGLVAISRDLVYILSVPPKFVPPCAPVLARTIPRGLGWLHEPKLDGYRFQVVKTSREVRLYSRVGTEWTKRLPGFADAIRRLPCRSAILDGELVLPDESGIPDFEGLQGAARACTEHMLVFFAFDLLYKNGIDLRLLPLTKRRQRLVRLIRRADIPFLHLVQAFENGAMLLDAAARHGLEGIVSKRQASPYRSGQSRHWVKIKTAAWREANRERGPSSNGTILLGKDPTPPRRPGWGS